MFGFQERFRLYIRYIANDMLKKKIHSSCEIEDFVENHLCKLCVILRSRVLLGVCVLVKDIGRRLPLQLQCSYQGQQGDDSQSVRGWYITGTPAFPYSTFDTPGISSEPHPQGDLVLTEIFILLRTYR